jgi:hypothetical protein
VRRLDISSRPAGLCLLLAAVSVVHAQLQIPPLPSGEAPPRQILDHYPQRPSLPVAFSVPVGPLGFSIPGDNYLLRKQRLVSLDFLDEDRLLFTFRVSGLMQRDAEGDTEGKKQQIRAVVLALPAGKIESQASWVVPDRSRYLWMLGDGHFLLRAREGLDEGDGQLKMKEYLRFPGRLLWIQMDPRQQMIITNTLETASAKQSADKTETASAKPNADTAADSKKAGAQGILVARTLRRASGEVIHESRVPWTSQTADWPMNSEGYLERSKEGSDRWLLSLNVFSGGNRGLAHIGSTCAPQYDFVSETELLVSACDPESGWKLRLMSTSGKLLWEVKAGTNSIWPLLAVAQSGSRVARETLLLKHSVVRYKRMLDARDLQGQMVRIFDAANGKVVLEAPLSPILDGGGNVAVSPSGKRVAILNAGAIQIFQLPAPASSASGH